MGIFRRVAAGGVADRGRCSIWPTAPGPLRDKLADTTGYPLSSLVLRRSTPRGGQSALYAVQVRHGALLQPPQKVHVVEFDRALVLEVLVRSWERRSHRGYPSTDYQRRSGEESYRCDNAAEDSRRTELPVEYTRSRRSMSLIAGSIILRATSVATAADVSPVDRTVGEQSIHACRR